MPASMLLSFPPLWLWSPLPWIISVAVGARVIAPTDVLAGLAIAIDVSIPIAMTIIGIGVSCLRFVLIIVISRINSLGSREWLPTEILLLL
eukprot:scaffold136305_cov14-Prasinocladus_malaysianus.AAC.1